MASNLTNTKVSRDRSLQKKKQTIFENVFIDQFPSGHLTFNLSYLKKNRGFIPGPYVRGTQGDHTVCYSIMVSSLERRLSYKTLSELIRFIAGDTRSIQSYSLHKDILILFHFYSKVSGQTGDFHIRDRLQRLHMSWKALLSGVYHLTTDSKGDLQFVDGSEGPFLKLMTDYILDYVFLLQYLPFSTAYAKPGEGSGYRGEGHAREFIEKLEVFSPMLEKEVLSKFSRLLDQRAIFNVIGNFSKHSFEEYREQWLNEIIAFQLLPILGILDGYPTVKEYFFGYQMNEKILRVSQAKLPNLALILFGEGDNEKYYAAIESALSLIAQFRSYKLLNFQFLL